jgi:hypothetical protein
MRKKEKQRWYRCGKVRRLYCFGFNIRIADD